MCNMALSILFNIWQLPTLGDKYTTDVDSDEGV